MKDPVPGRRGHRRLFWRIFAHGVLLVSAVMIAGGIAFHLVGDEPVWSRIHSRLGALFERTLDSGDRSGRGLEALLGDVSFVFGSAVAVYGDGGRLLAAAGEPVPAIPAPRACSGGAHGWYHVAGRRYAAVPLPSGRGCAVLEVPRLGSPERLAGALALALLLVALMSIPLARAVARPLERITDTARRIGGGDLAARTGITRNDEVGVLARTLDETAERLERRIRAEKELLAGASHELRTPLARIRVALELCDEPEAALGQIRDHLRGIAGDAAELERLLADAMTVARLDFAADGGSLPLRRETVRVAELVRESAGRLRAAHPERELVIAGDGGASEAEVDPQLVRRMLDNLLENAIKYSSAAEPVEIEAQAEGEGIVLEVRDRGIGIPPDDRERVFEPFFRTDRSRSRGTGGAGLGLTLCQRIAEAHGGSLVASARDGGGTVLRAELPATAPRDRDAPSTGSVDRRGDRV